MSHTSEAHGGGHSTHVMSPKLLLGVYGALVALTILTVSAIQIDLGGTANLIVAMGVATVKAALVVAFFMHLLYDKRFNLLNFISSLIFRNGKLKPSSSSFWKKPLRPESVVSSDSESTSVAPASSA